MQFAHCFESQQRLNEVDSHRAIEEPTFTTRCLDRYQYQISTAPPQSQYQNRLASDHGYQQPGYHASHEKESALTDGVVAAGEVVGGILLTGDQLLRVEELTVGTLQKKRSASVVLTPLKINGSEWIKAIDQVTLTLPKQSFCTPLPVR